MFVKLVYLVLCEYDRSSFIEMVLLNSARQLRHCTIGAIPNSDQVAQNLLKWRSGGDATQIFAVPSAPLREDDIL